MLVTKLLSYGLKDLIKKNVRNSVHMSFSVQLYDYNNYQYFYIFVDHFIILI